jgi:hypothetical protein
MLVSESSSAHLHRSHAVPFPRFDTKTTFSAALLLSSAQLFAVELVVAKMVLPVFGGTPAVWNTCMVFFQAMLLAGYLYAHVAVRLLPRVQVAIQVFLLLSPFAFFLLPVALPSGWAPPPGDYPVGWLLLVLLRTVGLPFFVLSTTAPLLQSWFAASGERSSEDPYFLYAASNIGSMAALLSYPTLVEPMFSIAAQNRAWAVGYVLLAGLIARSGWLFLRARTTNGDGQTATGPQASATPAASQSESNASLTSAEPPSFPRRLRWTALALVPSSLMLGATTHLTTDVAPVPLLWVVPLALYLLSFILVFGRFSPRLHRALTMGLPALVVLAVFLVVSEIELWIGLRFAAHLAVLFVVSMVCHGELARQRPPARYLTGFYLCLAFGGVLGGIFNGVLAPAIFASIVEYPLALVAACLLLPPPEGIERRHFGKLFDAALTVALGLAIVYLVRQPSGSDSTALPQVASLPWSGGEVAVLGVLGACLLAYIAFGKGAVQDRLLDVGLPVAVAAVTALLILHPPLVRSAPAARSISAARVVTYGVPTVLCLVWARRRVRFGLGVAGVVLAASAFSGQTPLDTDPNFSLSLIHQERSFFGVHRVQMLRGKSEQLGHVRLYRLLHGTTVHGQQRRHRDEFVVVRTLAPLLGADAVGAAADAIFARESLRVVHGHEREPLAYYHHTGPISQVYEVVCGQDPCAVGFVGLGTGTLASYVEPDQSATFYEIDPAVVRLAEDPAYFTYLRHCRGRPQPDGKPYRIELGDARLRLRDAADGGYRLIVVDAFSSDSIPVHLLTREAMQLYLAKLAPDGAAAFHLSNRLLRLPPVLARLAEDQGLIARENDDRDESQPGKIAARWVVVARDRQVLDRLSARHRGWQPLRAEARQPLWTDDFSNVFGIVRWSQ